MITKVLTVKLPVWAVAIIIVFFSSVMAVQQLLLQNANNKINQLKKDNALLAAGLESKKSEADKLKNQLATEAAICLEQINDRLTIKGILSSVKVNAPKPASSKAESVNSSKNNILNSGIDAEEAQVSKYKEVVSYETSTHVVDFINNHIGGM